MTETTVIETPAKPARRKKARRARRKTAVTVRASAAPDELAGMNAVDCPLECSAACCVISGRGYCAHPRKGGLQSIDLNDPAALDRAHRAKAALAHMAIDKRKS